MRGLSYGYANSVKFWPWTLSTSIPERDSICKKKSHPTAEELCTLQNAKVKTVGGSLGTPRTAPELARVLKSSSISGEEKLRYISNSDVI